MPRSTVSRSSGLSRRAVLGGALGFALGGRALSALAQATPLPAAVASMGLPELTVTLTDQAARLSPETVPAGLVVLTVVNQTANPSSAGVLGPGAGQTMQDLQREAATPTPGQGFPSFFYTATIVGGPSTAPPHGMAQAVIKLSAGDWVVFSEGNQPPAFFTATGGTPVSQTAPTASVTITEVDFAFGGFAATVPAGPQVWEVINQGTQPHMLILGQVPAGTTFSQVLEAVGRAPGATPPPGGLGPNDFQDRGGVILQSPGTTVWPVLDLPAGRYAAICFVPDPHHGGEPHAMEGMIAVFDVGATATPAP